MPTPNKKSRKKDPSYGRIGGTRYPVERSCVYQLDAGQTLLVDVAKGLCGQNHRLYRQGKMYRLKVELLSGHPTTTAAMMQSIQCHTLPDTWYLKKAWELAAAAREEQLTLSNRPKGRWDDFRVGWSSTYKIGEVPLDGGGNAITYDEIQLSKVHDSADSADHEFVVFGAAKDSGNDLYGMIEQYDQIGNTNQWQPHGGATNDAYEELQMDAGLVEAAGDLKALQGDNAPYDMDSFNGADDRGSVIKPMIYANAVNGSHRMSTTFDAPLGLIKVVNGSTDTNGTIATFIRVTALPGNYKGVRADDF